MNKRITYLLSEIATFSNGVNFEKSAYTQGVKLIGVSDFKDRLFPDYDSLQEIDSNAVRTSEYLCQGDIVFVRSNGNKELVGRSMLINKDVPVTFSGFCIRLRLKNTEFFNPLYFAYLFKSPQFRKELSGTAVGANIQNLSQGSLGACSVEIPFIDEQKRVASVLYHYDLLIDNYRKQIKLLEEAVQRLYKEWFVDLRFPGYENVKVVDGVPEGWNQCVLGDIAIDSGIRESKDNRDKYDYYVPIDCLPKKSLVYSDVENITLAESSLVSFVDGDILFGAMRPYFHKVCVAMGHGLTRSTCFVLNAKKRNLWSFLLLLLFEDSSIQYATKISVGTTMPYVRWKDFQSMKIVVPSDDIAALFDKEVRPIVSGLKTLSKQIPLLVEARDRLLPKLMNGEIEV